MHEHTSACWRHMVNGLHMPDIVVVAKTCAKAQRRRRTCPVLGMVLTGRVCTCCNARALLSRASAAAWSCGTMQGSLPMMLCNLQTHAGHWCRAQAKRLGCQKRSPVHSEGNTRVHEGIKDDVISEGQLHGSTPQPGRAAAAQNVGMCPVDATARTKCKHCSRFASTNRYLTGSLASICCILPVQAWKHDNQARPNRYHYHGCKCA